MRIKEISLDKIHCDMEFNSRDFITLDSIFELGESLKEHGLQTSIAVMPRDNPPYYYRILAGHRRYLAAKLLGWETIRAEIQTNLSEQEALVWNIVENLERKNLSPSEEAKSIQRLIDSGSTVQEVADALSKNRRWVQKRLKILKMPPVIQKDLALGRLSFADIMLLKGETEAEYLVMAAQLRRAKLMGVSTREFKRQLTNTRRSKSRDAIFNMIVWLVDTGVEASVFRALAWAAGDVLDEDFKADSK